jgi:hypothetical protein
MDRAIPVGGHQAILFAPLRVAICGCTTAVMTMTGGVTMAGFDVAETDRAIDEMIRKYGHETTSLDIIVNFFKGV